MVEALREQLQRQVMEELGTYGIACSDEQAALLVSHLLLVIEKNKVLNLTRILDPHDGVTLHIVDSLIPLSCDCVKLNRQVRYLDIGTGAGFPGIPLSILSGARGVLIDSVGKKVTAVNEFIDQLGLSGIEARQERAEELGTQEPSSFDYVFARAVAQSNVLIEYATPLLKMGGLVVLEKARPEDDEIEAASRAAILCGLELVSRETFELPRGLGHREVLMYQKKRKAKVKLPRRVGLAKKEPLGIEAR